MISRLFTAKIQHSGPSNSRSSSWGRLRFEQLEQRDLLAADFDWAFGLDHFGTTELSKVASDSDGHAIVVGNVVSAGTLDVDPSPNEVLLDLPDNGHFIAEYDADGGLLWAKAITGSARPYVRALAVFGRGATQSIAIVGQGSESGTLNIGSSTISVSGSDSFVLRLDTNGQLNWQQTIVGRAFDVAFDHSGNVVTTGNSLGGGKELRIAKLNSSNGSISWQHVLTSSSLVQPRSITTDPSGRVVVGGMFNGNIDFDPDAKKTAKFSSSYNAGFIATYSSTGAYSWASSFQPSSNARAEVFDVAVDHTGSVYTVGSYQGRVDFDPGKGKYELPDTTQVKAFITKLTSAGNFAWATSLDGSGNSMSLANALAIDAAGAVFVTGFFRGTIDLNPGPGQKLVTSADSSGSSFLLKLDNAGNFAYALSVGPGTATWSSIALAPGGRVLIAGNLNGSVDLDPDAVDEAILTANYGALLWSLR